MVEHPERPPAVDAERHADNHAGDGQRLQLPGRWGENLTRLDPNVQQVLAGTTVQGGLGTPGGDPWPLPGTSGGFLYTPPPPLAADDNNNYAESGQFQDEQGILHPAFVTPLDVFAAGSWVTGTEGKVRQLIAQGAQKYAQYTNYFTNNSVLWTNFFSGGLMSGGGPQFLSTSRTKPSRAVRRGDANLGQHLRRLRKARCNTAAPISQIWQSGPLQRIWPLEPVANARAVADSASDSPPPAGTLKSFGKEFLGAYSNTTPINDARRLVGIHGHQWKRYWAVPFPAQRRVELRGRTQ